MTDVTPGGVSDDATSAWSTALVSNGHRATAALGTFRGGSVVQLVAGEADEPGARVEVLHPATVTVMNDRILATDGLFDWSWLVDDLEGVVHGADAPWSILVVPGIADFGVSVAPPDVGEFRVLLERLHALDIRNQGGSASGRADKSPLLDAPASLEPHRQAPEPEPLVEVPPSYNETFAEGRMSADLMAALAALPLDSPASEMKVVEEPAVDRLVEPSANGAVSTALVDDVLPTGGLPDARAHGTPAGPASATSALTGIDARNISAWFGDHYVLDRVSLEMPAGHVTALIGPSGCGKSTFLRILNRMHEMIPSASLAGAVMLDGHDIYDPGRKVTDARREIGMVFQKPNPFPAMSIYDNVVASLRLTGAKATTALKDELVESCLKKAGLWTEVRDRLRQPGGGLSGGQQQRLCIARALAIKPRVLLMDEPCSALDPTSTRRIEETIKELVSEVTIVIVTHNMQQANRVSDRCAFFLAEQGTPGVIVEHGPTSAMFNNPQDPRTSDYVLGRFG